MTKTMTLKAENEWDKFCNEFKKLDMDNNFDVQLLAIAFRKWVEWNKGKCTIEILQSFNYQHQLFLFYIDNLKCKCKIFARLKYY